MNSVLSTSFKRQAGSEEQVVLERVGRALRSPPIPVPLRQQGDFGVRVEDGIDGVFAPGDPGAVVVFLAEGVFQTGTVAGAECAGSPPV